MLRWRLLLGSVLIAALVCLIWLDHGLGEAFGYSGLVLVPLTVIIAVIAVHELLSMWAASGRQLRRWPVFFGTVLVVASSGPPVISDFPQLPIGLLGWPLLVLAVAAALVLAGEMWRRDGSARKVENAALGVFALVYIGLMLSLVVQLRSPPGGNNAWGTVVIIALFAVVKLGDIGAYAVGRLVGKHKLAPQLSPGKTIEGLLGGLLFACIGSWLVFAVLMQWIIPKGDPVSLWRIVVFGLLVGTAGVFGDLAESFIKRDAGCKDSSKSVPGFGGVLDMLDSVLLAAPVVYLCWIMGLVGNLML